MESYGPTPQESYKAFDNKYLTQFINECTKYVSNLPPFLQYCLFRYSTGSASINSFLVFGKQSENAPYWTYLFFLYHFNTFGRVRVPRAFSVFTPFFNNPQSYTKLSKTDQDLIANSVIIEYIKTLQYIINRGPRTKGPFRIFKVSSKYPALPDELLDGPIDVVQQPFNSTTILPYFNFAIFTSKENTCCLFDITVPPGSRCLYIPQEIHAYPFEQEILLPFGCTFEVDRIVTRNLHFIDKEDINMTMIQTKNKIHMGNVYTINEFFPCKSGKCIDIPRPFMVYETVLISR